MNDSFWPTVERGNTMLTDIEVDTINLILQATRYHCLTSKEIARIIDRPLGPTRTALGRLHGIGMLLRTGSASQGDPCRYMVCHPLPMVSEWLSHGHRPRKLDWYHYDSDGIRSAIDARARIRFDPGPFRQEFRSNTKVITVDAYGGGAWQKPDVVLAGFNADFVRYLTQYDGTHAEALAHAIEMAEQWAYQFMGPGWEVVPAAEVRAAELAVLRPDLDHTI